MLTQSLALPAHFLRYDLFSKHGFMEGSRLVDEEYPLVEALCESVLAKMPVVANKWRIEIYQCNFHYLTFIDLTTHKRTDYFDMMEKDRRTIDAAFDKAGLL